MTPLPPDELSKGEEQTMRDWLENYRPVRQRTVRSETTKDTPGTLPPAVYSNANPNSTVSVFFPADQVEQTPTASSEMRSVVSDVSGLSFVSDATVPQLTLASTADFNQMEEYERDSDDGRVEKTDPRSAGHPLTPTPRTTQRTTPRTTLRTTPTDYPK